MEKLVLAWMLLFAFGAKAMVIPSGTNNTSRMTSTTTTTTTTTPDVPLVVDNVEPVGGRPMCLQNYFTCPDSACVPVLKVCDGTPDCSDGADERDCANIPTVILLQQTVAIMNKYPGCNAQVETCSNHMTVFGPPTSLSFSEVCRVYNRAAMCTIYESCDFSAEDQDFVKNVARQVIERNTDCEFVDIEHPDRCVSSCQGMANGDYQSCQGCGVYFSCYDGVAYDNRPCPGNLKWDNISKRCEYDSTTCRG